MSAWSRMLITRLTDSLKRLMVGARSLIVSVVGGFREDCRGVLRMHDGSCPVGRLALCSGIGEPDLWTPSRHARYCPCARPQRKAASYRIDHQSAQRPERLFGRAKLDGCFYFMAGCEGLEARGGHTELGAGSPGRWGLAQLLEAVGQVMGDAGSVVLGDA